jgi:Leucine-rich repeat (LRR) protein/predicted RNA-binding Zn-ribbon protein involved in translation (DUF1610 family)
MGCLNKDKEEFQKIEFLCPECGELPPEILNINVDNKLVEFKCKICAEKIYNSKYFYNHKFTSDNIINYYCKQKIDDNEDKFWFKEYLNQRQSLSDDRNFIQKIIPDGEYIDSKEIIRQKNEQIKQIIEFNKMLIEECENNKNNYYYLKSLNNVCNSLKKENFRDLNDLKFIFTIFNNDLEISKKEIVKFFDEKVDREKEYLFLNGKKLNNEKIKCLALIQFNNLKEIDLSGNEISKIEPLCKTNLPFLEFLNLSNNKIEAIEPLSEIISKKFNYLFIHDNLIKDEDIKVLYDPNFRTFEILTIQNNKITENSNQFNKLCNLYRLNSKILVTKIDQINGAFRFNEQLKEMELENTNEGDDILKKLFIIITYKNNYKIKTLKLSNNQIEDPSILNRIQFKHLENLFLSLNHIKNLDFLKGMKAKELQNLYLDDNYINDLSFLYNRKKLKELFPYLKLISLKKNNFNSEEPQYSEILTNILGEENINLVIIDNN